jgi:hypothetical protein
MFADFVYVLLLCTCQQVLNGTIRSLTVLKVTGNQEGR